MTLMSTYGKEAGIEFNFQGTVANTIDAHRLIQHCQETIGAEGANKVVDCKSLLSLFLQIIQSHDLVWFPYKAATC